MGFRPKRQLDLRILLIDNHDSYTYNLYQYLSTMTTQPVEVVMNDAFASWADFLSSYGHNQFDCIILSPGPGRPSHSADMGIVLDTIRRNADVPILGVCLGHQALGHVYGKEVTLSPGGPVHGLTSAVVHDEIGGLEKEDDLTCQLFRGIPQEFEVVRYHSLVVDCLERDIDSEIEPIAWCNSPIETSAESRHRHSEDICMALRHKRHPHYGVQFHPESIGTGEAGYQLLWNFCEFAHEYNQRKIRSSVTPILRQQSFTSNAVGEDAQVVNNRNLPTQPKYRVFIHKVDRKDASPLPLPQQVFETLYSSRPNSFWLDSSTGEAQFNQNNIDEGCPITSNSRFSIMGSDDGPLSRKIEYFGREHEADRRGVRVSSTAGDEEVMPDEDILSYLRCNLVDGNELTGAADVVTFDERGHKDTGLEYTLRTVNEFDSAGDQIPFDYRGGYVGYLGYEVRRDTQCWIFEQEGGYGCSASDSPASSGTANPKVPTAAFLFVDRSLLYDHQTGDWYMIGVAENGREGAGIEDTVSWMQRTRSKFQSMESDVTASSNSQTNAVDAEAQIPFVPNRSKAQYQLDIARSHEEIRNGESYELCVTNQLEAELTLPKHPSKATHESPFELYKLLREKNPAPFSAFLNFYGDAWGMCDDSSGALSICCSSPERFLSVKKAQPIRNAVNDVSPKESSPDTRFVVESKPIKGTAARYTGGSNNGIQEPDELVQLVDSQIAAELSESVKDRAENLMIVDLLRNDLGRVCEVGSVHVPKLMHIESYATVHQMVSTVRGTLDGDAANAIDAIEACFPGGSMTGAPKQRTMEILDEIEQGVSRGPYSGCLGYISLNGCMDMNIIIRSSVLTPSNESEEGPTETWKASIGCGGAITALSNSEDEYEEMLLKSRVVRKTISEWVADAVAQRSLLESPDGLTVK
ncbi:hypothetical protein ACHAXT_010709 [Thalassiosira profunda]